MKRPQLPTTAIAQLVDLQGKTDPMPHDIDLECKVLGIILCDCSIEVQQAIGLLNTSSFYDPSHKIIFAEIKKQDEEIGTADISTLAMALKKSGNLRAVGGMAYISGLTLSAGTGINILQQAQILIQLNITRELINLGFNTMIQGIEGSEDVDSLIQNIETTVEKVLLDSIQTSNRQSLKVILANSIEKIKEREARRISGLSTGITTGLKTLDLWTNGWQGGELLIIAGRPAMGKTALLVHFAISAAKSGVPAVIYSLEMNNISLGNRMLLSQCDVAPEALKSGRLDNQDWIRLGQAQQAIQAIPLQVDEKPAVTLQYIATNSRILQKRGECGIIFIDYLQLMTMKSEKGGTREREVATTTAALKQLAKELNVPVVLLSQLSRETEKRGGHKEPILSDLRESGAIEQDADMVMFIHRAEYYEKERDCFDKLRLSNGKEVHNVVPMKGLGKLIIAKYREGATGDVKFSYNPSLTQIRDFDESPYLGSSQFGGVMPTQNQEKDWWE